MIFKIKALVVILCISLLYGCSQAASETTSSELPEGTQTVYGKIKEINGNEVLLAIADYNERSSMGGPQTGQNNSENNKAPLEDEEQAENNSPPAQDGDFEGMPQDDGEGFPTGEGFPADGGGSDSSRQERYGGRGGQSGERQGGNRQGAAGGAGGGMGNSAGGASSVTLTGEEIQYQIPVTALVTTGQGDNAQTIRFTQLAVKNLIRLSIDDSGKILQVVVLQ